MVLFEDEIARLLALNLTHDDFLRAFLNPFKRSAINDLLLFETEFLGGENVHDREKNFLFGEFFKLISFVKCTLKQIKDKKPFFLVDCMKILAEPGIE